MIMITRFFSIGDCDEVDKCDDDDDDDQENDDGDDEQENDDDNAGDDDDDDDGTIEDDDDDDGEVDGYHPKSNDMIEKDEVLKMV